MAPSASAMSLGGKSVHPSCVCVCVCVLKYVPKLYSDGLPVLPFPRYMEFCARSVVAQCNS